MPRITTRTTAFAIAIVSLGFAATGAGSAIAHEAHRHLAQRLTVTGYAGPAPSSARTYLQFAPSRGILGKSCDLPSSACPNDERITN